MESRYEHDDALFDWLDDADWVHQEKSFGEKNNSTWSGLLAGLILMIVVIVLGTLCHIFGTVLDKTELVLHDALLRSEARTKKLHRAAIVQHQLANSSR